MPISPAGGYPFIRTLLFKLDAETAHSLTIQLLRLAGRQPFARILQALFRAPDKPVDAFGLAFRNPVGLAAGYDKDGLAWRGLAALGFGHLELGTVTLRPQPGNPRPRIFRLVEDQALINRMGFPGQGAGKLATRLPTRGSGKVRLGVNLGKNKDTPLETAAEDYTSLVRCFAPLADYLAVNVSSPNTAGLRRLQGRDMLESLLGAVSRERRALPLQAGGQTPILVKLAPDLTDEELEDALDAILACGMDGVIATNTTLGREGLRSPRKEQAGGMSGQPLKSKSASFLQKVTSRLESRLPVVSVGGIMGAEDARARLEAGAALVQVYTGLVYAGPGLVREILKGL